MLNVVALFILSVFIFIILNLYYISHEEIFFRKSKDDCVIKGCNKQFCVKRKFDVSSYCDWKCKYGCYSKYALCKKSADRCVWTTNKLKKFNDCIIQCEKDRLERFKFVFSTKEKKRNVL